MPPAEIDALLPDLCLVVVWEDLQVVGQTRDFDGHGVARLVEGGPEEDVVLHTGVENPGRLLMVGKGAIHSDGTLLEKKFSEHTGKQR